MKNSEKIKSMADEELAEFLTDFDFCSDVCSRQFSDCWKDKCPGECRKYALKWLELQEEDVLWES